MGRCIVVPADLSPRNSRWFDGIDDRIYGATSPIDGTGPWTVAVWVKPDWRAVGAPQTIYAAGGYTGNDTLYLACFGGATPGSVNFGGGTSASFPLFTGSYPIGRWYRVVMTHADGAASVSYYVDGVARGTGATVGINLTGGNFNIGSWLAATDQFKGNIWDLRRYQRCWSLAEVVTDFLGERVDSTGLVRWWQLNDQTPATTRESVVGTNDAVTGAAIHTSLPTKRRRLDETVPYAAGARCDIADSVALRPGNGSWAWMQWWYKPAYLGTQLATAAKSVGGTFMPVYQHTNNYLYGWVNDGVTGMTINSLTPISQLSGWQHIASVFDKTAMVWYLLVDAQVIVQIPILPAMANIAPTSGLTLAADGKTLYNDVMWRKGSVFSWDEIDACYYDSVIPSGLTAYWPCREGTGTAVADVVGGFNGTLTSATWSGRTRSR